MCVCVCVCVLSASPPPPSLLQFSPQLPLMGFVARVQESSESNRQFLINIFVCESVSDWRIFPRQSQMSLLLFNHLLRTNQGPRSMCHPLSPWRMDMRRRTQRWWSTMTHTLKKTPRGPPGTTWRKVSYGDTTVSKKLTDQQQAV